MLSGTSIFIRQILRSPFGCPLGFECLFLLLILISNTSCNCLSHTADREIEVPDSLKNRLEIDTAEFAFCETSFEGHVIYDLKNSIQIYPGSSGKIRVVKAAAGQYVRKGETLAIINNVEVLKLKEELFRAQENFSIAEKNLHIAKELYKNGINSISKYRAAERDYFHADSELKRIKAALKQFKFSVKKEHFEIKAPQDGFIVEENVSEGMELSAGNKQPIFSISNATHITVQACIPEKIRESIKIGDTINFGSKSWLGKKYPGKLDSINEKEGMWRLIIQPLPTVLNDIRLPLHITVSIRNSDHKKIVIPATAVIYNEKKPLVLVLTSNNIAGVRELNISNCKSNKFFVNFGLKEGERVITKGQIALYRLLK